MKPILLFSLALLSVLASCNKPVITDGDPCAGDPPPNSNLYKISFQLLNDKGDQYINGQNNSVYNFSSLVVTQPCVSGSDNVRIEQSQGGLFRMYFAFPGKGTDGDCTQILFKWKNGDVDTVTFSYYIVAQTCYNYSVAERFAYNATPATVDSTNGIVYSLVKH